MVAIGIGYEDVRHYAECCCNGGTKIYASYKGMAQGCNILFADVGLTISEK